MDKIFLGLEDVLAFLELRVVPLDLMYVRLRFLVKLAQAFQRIIVGLLQISIFQLCIGYLPEDLVPSLSLVDPFLVVIDASIVILGQKQHVSVILDLLKGLGAVLVVGYDCPLVRC